MSIHLVKLAVGVSDLHDLATRQPCWSIDYNDQIAAPVRTRHKPTRSSELVNGGSLYWVVKGNILCRQEIIGIEQIEDDEAGKFCMIMLDTPIVMTDPIARRPFQGWRYLKGGDVPGDRGLYVPGESEGELSPEMAGDLKDAGLI